MTYYLYDSISTSDNHLNVYGMMFGTKNNRRKKMLIRKGIKNSPFIKNNIISNIFVWFHEYANRKYQKK